MKTVKTGDNITKAALRMFFIKALFALWSDHLINLS
jgi:hypothetical protein